MDEMSDLAWEPRLDDRTGPKYLAIVEALADDISQGRLRVGDRLPPQRQLADALKIDVSTVTRAFSEAQRRGLIDARAGRGSFVCRPADIAPDAAPLSHGIVLDLGMNAPPQPPGENLRTLIERGMAQILAAPNAMLQLHYQDSAGIEAHRAIAARWLGKRLGALPLDRVVITSGAQSALYNTLMLLADAGDTICAGSLTYPGLKAIAERMGLGIAPLPMDEHGILPDAFADLCRRNRPKLLYCIPTIDNPTTATLPQARREAIAAIARQHGVWIVEDDAYGALPAAAPQPIAAIAPEITWHIATLSKCASPALRIAYVATPDLSQTLRLAAEARVTSLMASPLMSALAAQWIADGTLDRIAAAIRAENNARQQLARQLLAGADYAAQLDGHHLWLKLPAHWRRADFVAQALQSGLSIVASDAFATNDQPPEAVRISLGIVPDLSSLERALKLLTGLLGRRAATAPVI